MQEKIKGALFNLGVKWSSSFRDKTELLFDEAVWNDMVDAAVEAGFNTIFLDIHEGLQYGSYPELAVTGAWTRQRMRTEIKRLKEMGITLVPKLNFSACHDFWLGQYRFQKCTKTYYRVCRELIREMCELFADSPYFHIGMDEEDERHMRRETLVMYRKGEQFFKDYQFLLDCVRDCGKTPVAWISSVVNHYEDFKKFIPPENLILGFGYYHGIKPEHWTRTDSREDYYKYYHVSGTFGGIGYAGMNMEYIERDDPFYENFRQGKWKQFALDGYDTMIVTSNFYLHPHNADDVVDMALHDWPQERLRGIISATWNPTTERYREQNLEGIRMLGAAFRKYGF